MPAIRALLVALDDWVTNGRDPPPSRLPSIAGGTLVRGETVAWPALAPLVPPRASNDVADPGDWTDPQPPARACQALVPEVDADGNEIAGIRLPDIAVQRGTFTGWNLYRAPLPAGELADRDGTYIAFTATRTEREQAGDPRSSLEERYPTEDTYVARMRRIVAELQRDRLLLDEDAAAYLARRRG